MDLPDAQDKFHVLMNQLQNPKGKPVHSLSTTLMNIYFCFIDYAKAFDCVDTINSGIFWKRWEYQTTGPASWETCMQVRKQQLELDMEQQTGSK